MNAIESGDFALCASNISISGSGKEEPLLAKSGIVTSSDLFYENHIGSFSCALINSSALQAVGGLHKIPSLQDWSTWIDLSKKGSLLKLADPTCLYDDTVDAQRISMNIDNVIMGHSKLSEKILLLAKNEMPRRKMKLIEAHLDLLLIRRLHFAKAPKRLIFEKAFFQLFKLNHENAYLYFRVYFRVFFFPRTLPSWASLLYRFLRSS